MEKLVVVVVSQTKATVENAAVAPFVAST